MAPKKDSASLDNVGCIAGFDARETRMLAAAYIAQTGPDKYDYNVMATLTGNTPGSLQKIFPPVKRKAAEAYPKFSAFLGGDVSKTAKPKTVRKRKAESTEAAERGDSNDADTETPAEPKAQKVSGKGKGRASKKAKVMQDNEENIEMKAGEDDSADGGD
ncbi:uncharacterized protein BDR25DRAFT_181666, partial [Lindgomyces ingoldianus]